MYEFTMRSKKAEKQFFAVLKARETIREKLELLREFPRTAIGAHKLKGRLYGYWGAVLGADLRIVYEIDDKNKLLIVASAGSHKEAYAG